MATAVLKNLSLILKLLMDPLPAKAVLMFQFCFPNCCCCFFCFLSCFLCFFSPSKLKSPTPSGLSAKRKLNTNHPKGIKVTAESCSFYLATRDKEFPMNLLCLTRKFFCEAYLCNRLMQWQSLFFSCFYCIEQQTNALEDTIELSIMLQYNFFFKFQLVIIHSFIILSLIYLVGKC